MSPSGPRGSSSSSSAPAGTRCWGRRGWPGSARRRSSSWRSTATRPLPYIIALVAALAVAYTLAWLLPRLGAQSAGGGAKAGVALGLALIGTTFAQAYGFEARPVSLWLINAGYMIVGMALMGAIVGHLEQTRMTYRRRAPATTRDR